MQRFTRGHGRWTRCLAPILALSVLSAGPALAAPLEEDLWVDLGQADSIAIDQPRVFYQLARPGTDIVDGPDELFAQALLDTGANGVVLAMLAYLDSLEFQVDEDRYAVATRDDGSKVQYSELGVAGTHFFDVLEEYDLYFNEFSPDPTLHLLEDVRPIGDPDIDFGGFSGIVGMPAMINRRTTLDLSTLLDPEPDHDFYMGLPYIDVAIEHLDSSTTDAGGGPDDNEYHIDFRMWMPPHSDPIQEGDPTPTFAPMPFVDDVRIGKRGSMGDGSFLLDTGAQLTLVSYHVAEAAGVNFDMVEDGGDVIDFMQLGGVGGSTMAPVVEIDHLDIPTTNAEGETIYLRFSDFHVAVLDIGEPLIEEPLDGILGMNLLTSGYAEAVIEMIFGDEFDSFEEYDLATADLDQGFFEQFAFEFVDDDFNLEGNLLTTTEGSTIGGGFSIRVAEEYHQLVPEPGSAALLGAMAGLLLMRRRRAA